MKKEKSVGPCGQRVLLSSNGALLLGHKLITHSKRGVRCALCLVAHSPPSEAGQSLLQARDHEANVDMNETVGFRVPDRHWRTSSSMLGDCYRNPLFAASAVPISGLNGPPSAAYLPLSVAKTPGTNGRSLAPTGLQSFGQSRTAGQ